MRKVLALTLAATMALNLAACGGKTESAATDAAPAETAAQGGETTGEPAGEAVASDQVAKIEWAAYDDLIKQIKSATDMDKREAMMHEAEDMLMNTWATIPLYYYNDHYMQKENIQGIYANPNTQKFFWKATGMKDKTLRICLASEPEYLDPTMCTATDNMTNAHASFIGLMNYNEKGELYPEMAESYEISDDKLTFTFKIKPGLKWSDGEVLDANDIVYSWNRAVKPETTCAYEYLFAGIEGYEEKKLNIQASEDGLTFTVKLTAPCAYFLDLCSFPTFFPVPQQAVEAADETNPGSWAMEPGFPVSGPFITESWKHNESLVYAKNPNFYRTSEQTVDRLEFMLSANDSAIFTAYKSGNLDFIENVAPDELDAVLGTPEFHILDQMGPYYMSFNVTSPLFAGKTVQQAADMRHAIALLIDRDYIVSNISKTGQKIANTFVPPVCADGHGGEFRQNNDGYEYPEAEDLGYFKLAYSDEKVEQARELLKGAGYEFGDDGMLSADTPLSFEYMTNEMASHVAIAQAIQQDLAVLGIDMKIKNVDWNLFLADRHNGKYDVARHGWTSDYNDPINFLELFATDSVNNDAQIGR